jgi:hypothetical protein
MNLLKLFQKPKTKEQRAKEKEALMYILPSGILTYDKTKNESPFKLWIKSVFKRKSSPVGKLISVDMTGVPTFDREEGRMVESVQNTDAYEKLVRVQGEVIAPMPYDTAEDIASLMSCAACDHEFSRVIVYPVTPELRTKVLELIENDHINYPMYEYMAANIVSNDDLNAQTIIYKHAGRTHYTKPV